MDLFKSKKTDIQDIQEQIKVLDTNLEVLNQKLIADPNATITPGEAIIKKQLLETISKLNEVESFLKKSQDTITKEMLESADILKSAFENVKARLDSLPHERDELHEEIKRLHEITDYFAKINKASLAQLLARMDILNNNVGYLNNNLFKFYDKLTKDIFERVNGISEQASSKIFKNMMWFILSMIFLSVILTLVAVKFITGFIP